MSGCNEFDATKQPKYKVELHVHLDGSVRIPTIWNLAQQKDYFLPHRNLQELSEAITIQEPSTLANFLKPFCLYMPLIVGDSAAIERLAYEFCEDSALQGVYYSEVRYSPHLLSTCHRMYARADDGQSLSPREVVLAVNKGLEKGMVDFEITVRSILCCFRGHPEWSSSVLDLCLEFRQQGVVGIDIAGDEKSFFADPIDIEVFQRAAAHGVHRTVHAGEDGPASNVRIALNDMSAERIGHGYHVIEDPHLYEECLRRGVHFETCPYSSRMTGSVLLSCPKHPVVRFAEDGANFSVSRDDPTIIQKSLDEEYAFLRELGLKEVHLVRANFNAARHSFLPEGQKQVLLRQLQRIYGIQKSDTERDVDVVKYIPVNYNKDLGTF